MPCGATGMLFLNGTFCCAAPTVESRSTVVMSQPNHLCFKGPLDLISTTSQRENRKETRLRKPLSIAPLQFFGVAAGRPSTNLQPLHRCGLFWFILARQKRLARRRGLCGPANGVWRVEPGGGLDAGGAVSGGPAVPAYRR